MSTDRRQQKKITHCFQWRRTESTESTKINHELKPLQHHSLCEKHVFYSGFGCLDFMSYWLWFCVTFIWVESVWFGCLITNIMLDNIMLNNIMFSSCKKKKTTRKEHPCKTKKCIWCYENKKLIMFCTFRMTNTYKFFIATFFNTVQSSCLDFLQRFLKVRVFKHLTHFGYSAQSRFLAVSGRFGSIALIKTNLFWHFTENDYCINGYLIETVIWAKFKTYSRSGESYNWLFCLFFLLDFIYVRIPFLAILSPYKRLALIFVDLISSKDRLG